MALFKNSLQSRRVIAERGFAIPNAYFERVLQQKGWEKFASHPPVGIGCVVREFYTNVLHHYEHTCFVRGKWVPFGPESINNFYGLGEVDESQFLALRENIN